MKRWYSFLVASTIFCTFGAVQADEEESVARCCNKDKPYRVHRVMLDGDYTGYFHCLKGIDPFIGRLMLENGSWWMPVNPDPMTISKLSMWREGDWIGIRPTAKKNEFGFVLVNLSRGIDEMMNFIMDTPPATDGPASCHTIRLDFLSMMEGPCAPFMVYLSDMSQWKIAGDCFFDIMYGPNPWSPGDDVMLDLIEEAYVTLGTVVVKEKIIIFNLTRGTYAYAEPYVDPMMMPMPMPMMQPEPPLP